MVEDLSRRKVIKKVDVNDDDGVDDDVDNNVDSCMTLARKERRDGTETIFFEREKEEERGLPHFHFYNRFFTLSLSHTLSHSLPLTCTKV